MIKIEKKNQRNIQLKSNSISWRRYANEDPPLHWRKTRWIAWRHHGLISINGPWIQRPTDWYNKTKKKETREMLAINAEIENGGGTIGQICKTGHFATGSFPCLWGPLTGSHRKFKMTKETQETQEKRMEARWRQQQPKSSLSAISATSNASALTRFYFQIHC